jgi:hypothetical protein
MKAQSESVPEGYAPHDHRGPRADQLASFVDARRCNWRRATQIASELSNATGRLLPA